MTAKSRSTLLLLRALAILALCCLAIAGSPPAQAAGNDPQDPQALDPIVINGSKATKPADEALRRQVQAALHDDPFFYDAHVTVTVHDGVVTLEGFVFDLWDLRDAMRIGSRIPGVKRIDSRLDIIGLSYDNGM
jgi:osmotically-inducible protein OsmY